VTGIGHEIDFTIADFAADLRAPTPTGAAERVSPDVAEWRERLARLGGELVAAMREHLDAGVNLARQRADRLERAHPGRRLEQWQQRLDELQERLPLNVNRLLAERHARLKGLAALVQSLGPGAVLARGYAIVHTADGSIARDAASLATGDELDIALARGRVGARVTDRG
jgi:exodeoxyribonuclease VII large subunit